MCWIMSSWRTWSTAIFSCTARGHKEDARRAEDGVDSIVDGVSVGALDDMFWWAAKGLERRAATEGRM